MYSYNFDYFFLTNYNVDFNGTTCEYGDIDIIPELTIGDWVSMTTYDFDYGGIRIFYCNSYIFLCNLEDNLYYYILDNKVCEIYPWQILFYCPNLIIDNYVCGYDKKSIATDLISIKEQSGEYNEDLPLEKYTKYSKKARYDAIIQKKLKEVNEVMKDINLGSKKKKRKKNFLKKLKTQHYNVKHQDGGFDVKEVIAILEQFCGAFLLGYMDKPIWKAIGTILVLFKGNISTRIYSMILNIFNEQNGTISQFLDWLKSLIVDVETFKNNRLAKSFMTMVSKCFTCFLSPNVLSFFSEESENKIVSYIFKLFGGEINPMESILNCVTYLTNGVHVFVTTGKLDGFLETETTSDTMLTTMRKLRDKYVLYNTGDLEFIMHFKHYDFQREMADFKFSLNSFRKSRRGQELRMVDDWIKELDKMMVSVEAAEAHKTSRIQPYHFILTSGTGISKSNLTTLMVTTIALANDIPCGKAYTYILNLKDKFQSAWKNYFTIIIADDTNSSREPGKNGELRMDEWSLRSSNNVPHPLLGAGVDEKGALWNRSLIEIWTSNSFLQDFHKVARNASAMHRRFACRIVARVRPQFVKKTSDPDGNSCQIDYTALSPEQQKQLAPDAWLFTVYDCEIRSHPIPVKTEYGAIPAEEDDDYRFCVMRDDKEILMKDVNIETVLKFLVWHSKKWFSTQQKVMEHDERLNDLKNYCKHGLPKDIFCKDCNKMDCESMIREINLRKSFTDKYGYRRDKNPNLNAFKLAYIERHPVDIACKEEAWERFKYWLRSNMGGPLGHVRYDTSSLPQKLLEYLRKSENVTAVDYKYEKQNFTRVIKRYTYRDKQKPFGTRDEYMTITKYKDDWYRFTTSILNFDLGVVCQDNNHDFKVQYLKDLTLAIQDREILKSFTNISKTADLFSSCKQIVKQLMKTLESWFDIAVCEVIEYFIWKLVAYIETFIDKPTAMIPSFLEGTIVSAYCYTKHPVLRVAMYLDYVTYLAKCEAIRMFEPTLVHTIEPVSDVSDFVYDKFIRTKTRYELEQERKRKPLSIEEHSMKLASKYSGQEKDIKEEKANLLFEGMVTVVAASVVCSRFIPAFCRKFSMLYTEAQVGHSMSVDDIIQMDQETQDKFYLRRKELMCVKPDTIKTIPYTEAEHLVCRNLFYIRCAETGLFDNVLSYYNKFLIIPKHFAVQHIGKVMQAVKVEIEDYNKPGNALIEFTMDEQRLYQIHGDLMVLYLPQQMDHMRTKSLLEYFPNRLSNDTMSGRIYHKNRLGSIEMIDCQEIVASETLNNEDLSFGQVAKNPFKGYKMRSKNFPGLCGSPVLDHYHKNSQILGIHVGGSTEISVACAVFREDLEAAMRHFQPDGVVIQSGFNTRRYGHEIHMEEVYRKNPYFDTVDRIDGVEILGSVGSRITPEAKVVHTPIDEEVRQAFAVDYYWGPPPFKYGGDKRHGFRRMIKAYASTEVLKHPKILHRAVEDYRSEIDNILESDTEEGRFFRKEIRKLKFEEIVNGIPGKRFCKSMNMSTKFSSHKPGKKSDFATQRENGTWEFNDEVVKEYNDVKEKMSKGEWVCHLVVQMLKNEATLNTKIDEGKVRSFYTSDTVTQMIIREYLLTTCRFYCLNTPTTETTVGINPHGIDWTKMASEWLGFEKKENIIALDLKNFDLTTLFELVEAAIDIMFDPILKYGDLSAEDRRIIVGLKHSLLYSVTVSNGELVVLPGIIPSGTPITSMLGSIINSLNYRMAYYYIYPDIKKKFREVVCLRTYGDDSIANVKRGYPEMSVKGILKAWHDMGIQGTDLDKLGWESKRKYYKKEDVEFLKRKIVYDRSSGYYFAPLALASMLKSVCAHTPPKFMSIEAITGQCIDNFLFEAKFHKKPFYNKARDILTRLAFKHDLARFCLTLNMTYEDQIELWHKSITDKLVITKSSERSLVARFRQFLSDTSDSQHGSEWTQQFTEEDNNIDAHQSVFNLGVVSEETQEIKQQAGIEQQETLDFVQRSDSNSISIGGEMPRQRVDDNSVSIQEFLSRPVKISSVFWGSTQLGYEIDPWSLLINNRRISNKLATYKLFRAKCHVKFVLNGNGFYYGKAMASYLPFSQIDTYTNTKLTDPLVRIPASQLPHIFLDPTYSQGGEMILPFFYPADYVDLKSTDDIRSLGSIQVRQMTALKHANLDIASTGDTINIVTYAWFTDVELQGPTHEDPQGIVAQSGKEKETPDKPVSQACTALARFSRTVSIIPVIKPYALAVEQGALVASKVASALGYCRPNDPQEPEKYTPRMTTNLAVTNTTDNSNKLTTDVKQDLTIDPRTVGLGGIDELGIQYLASRESYYGSFIWAESFLPEQIVHCTYVTPYMFYYDTPSTLNNIWPTAICGVANAFEFWTGSLEYHFQIVSSAFHRGRLAFVYDPNPYNGATVPREDNVAFTHIVDIAETREFTMKIGNYQDVQWLKVQDSYYNTPVFSTASLSADLPWANGTITVYVINKLTTPAATPSLNVDITVNCYVKAGDDFQVAVPSNRITTFRAREPDPPAGIKMQSGTESADVLADQNSETKVTQSNELLDVDRRMYIGETIDSFRTLLKRYNGYAAYIDTDSGAMYEFEHQMYPLDPSDTYAGFTNNLNNTLINYMNKAFAGMCGSIRWKCLTNIDKAALVQVSRTTATATIAQATFTYSSATTHIGNVRGALSEVMDGSVITYTKVNPVIDFEIPFYSNYRFIAGKPAELNTAALPYCVEGFKVYSRMDAPSSLSNEMQQEFYVAGGEDLNFLFFTGFQPYTIVVI